MLQLTTNGMTATIQNVHLEVALAENASVSSLKFDGVELLNNLTGEPRDPDKTHSFYLDYHMAGKTVNMNPSRMEVITDTPELVDVAYTDDTSVLGLTYHFVVREDDPAIYGYVEAWNNTNQSIEVNELRTVYRLDHNLFDIGYNAERQGKQPTSAHMMAGEKLQDETYRMQDGSLYTNSDIYSKYDYAGYLSENPLWGQYGHDYGLWFIPVDASYFPSGPLNQDLLVHYDGLILNYMTGSHFGTGNITIAPGWHKFYGPWCVLVTHGKNLVATAQKRAVEEQAAWPYPWLNNAAYPKALSRLSGALTLSATAPATPFIVVLAKPSADGTFMHQQGGYIYYSKTDTNGHFEFDRVRPDTYTLYAYADGGSMVGMQHLDGVVVSGKDATIPTWALKPQAPVCWQIGSSTHTTDGFVFSSQLRNHIFKDLVPANLTYHVGRPKERWYYLQNDAGVWQIKFAGDTVEINREAMLHIAFAGVTKKVMTEPRGTEVVVTLNGQPLTSARFDNDSAGYRSALRGGNYELLEATIPAGMLWADTNTIGITTDGYLLYDTVLMTQEARA